MSNIRIDIASEFKDKGFKNAEKASTGLQGSFKKLGVALAGALSVQKVVQFGKASVQAFSDDEQAAIRLSKSISNLGLAFEDSRIRAFISDLETTSGVLDDKLRPAFQSLLQTTGSVTKSQDLLKLALDVAAGSGEDVVTVAGDLSKAYIGNTRALFKYNTGLSKTELQTKSFADVQAILANQFSGQNAAYLDTFAGKVATLNVAYANMQETIGKGLVDAFEILSGDRGIAGGTSAMQEFGDEVADTTRGIAELIAGFKDLKSYVGLVREFGGSLIGSGNLLTAIQSVGKVKPSPFRTPMSISGSTDLQVKIDRARAKAEADAAKRAKELLALTKKQVKTQEALNKKKKEDGILGEIAKRFDMERIQIAAALGGQINEVERIRLELMRAILDEDVKRAIILEGQLIKAEAAAQELATLLDSLDEMVGDPFADWPGTITRVQELLKQLKINIPIETLFAEKGLKLDQNKMTVTTLDRMDVDANNVYINGQLQPTTNPSAVISNNPSSNSELSSSAFTEYAAGNPIVIAAVESHADAMLTLAESELALADLLLEESTVAAAPTIIVNVEGSVTTVEDLAETITNIQYNYQRSGTNLRFSSIAI